MSDESIKVSPIIDNGVRYEAESDQLGAARLHTISRHLEKAMRVGMESGQTIDPQDPAWLRATLASCQVPSADIDAFLELMAFQAVVAPVMMRVTQRLLSQATSGLPSLEGPEMRKALEDDGALTCEQIDRVLTDMAGSFSKQSPHSVGLLVARDATTDQKLWQLQVCPPEVDIHSFHLDGGELLVTDSAGRKHRVDLERRIVIETSP